MKRSRRATSVAGTVLLAAIVAGALLFGPYIGLTSGHLGESTFASVVEPVGVAATPGRLLVTHPFCGNPREVLSIDSSGVVSVFATLPPLEKGCREEYIAVAGPADPTQPGFPSPTRGGFQSNFVYVTQGSDIVKISPDGVVSAFTEIPGCQPSRNGITFDRVGSFEFKMIVACNGGKVWKVAANGTSTRIAHVAAALGLASVSIENPDVAPQSFAPYGGHIFVAAGVLSKVLAISPSGAVSAVADWPSAEGVPFIPATKCTFGPALGSFFTAIFRPAAQGLGDITQFPLAAFSGLSGRALVTSDGTGGIGLLTSTGQPTIIPTVFHANLGRHEGSTFVDCTVPLILQIIVKPGFIPHTIDPQSKGTVPVAILSSPIFNALTDPIISTITFGFTGTERSIESCNTKSGQDVNGDGRLDLICNAVIGSLGIPTQEPYSGPLILKLRYNAPTGDPDGEGIN